jgi:DNA mismatch repair protein MutS2
VPGMHVRLRSSSANGVLQAVRGTEARVAVSGKRLWVAVAELEAADSGPAGKSKPTRIEVEVEEAHDRELMLLGLDAEDARERVERFLDRSHASGVGVIRIVHGHGTGTLRRMVAEVLRSHPAVVSFAHPPGNRGGTGATEVTLEQ